MNGHASSNGTRAPRRELKPGINVPMVAFFQPGSEDLDLETTAKHAVRLAQAGMTSLTVQGSNGEAVHLSREERMLVTKTVRRALDDHGFSSMPLVVGCTDQSTRGTVQFCKDAYENGGDYALVLPPSYYRTMYTDATATQYFEDVASGSPIPIIIYNYPGAVAGVDLSSEVIIRLARHPNIRGCKLTCGNTGKLNRIAHATDAATHRSPGSGWMCMGGSADFTLQTMVAGGSGIITGLGNVAPKACVEVYKLYAQGQVEEAQRVQAIVARGDWGVISGNVPGTKAGMEIYYGYGGVSRRPLPAPTQADMDRYKGLFSEIVKFENSL